MKKQNTEVLIVTRSIPLADGLEALLNAIPQINGVDIVMNIENALQQIEARKTRLVLLDLVLSGNQPEKLLERIHRLSPETQRVLLVNDAQDVNWLPQHAEAILIKGDSPSAVATIVTDLLLSKGDKK